ncbi:hypothetical protein KW823_27925, partial [Enterobacter quasiroggenkampii]|nr:hypothetical protein [Enterobacter quasiroggenkampii]
NIINDHKQIQLHRSLWKLILGRKTRIFQVEWWGIGEKVLYESDEKIYTKDGRNTYRKYDSSFGQLAS